jgi:hypothetical protein
MLRHIFYYFAITSSLLGFQLVLVVVGQIEEYNTEEKRMKPVPPSSGLRVLRSAAGWRAAGGLDCRLSAQPTQPGGQQQAESCLERAPCILPRTQAALLCACHLPLLVQQGEREGERDEGRGTREGEPAHSKRITMARRPQCASSPSWRRRLALSVSVALSCCMGFSAGFLGQHAAVTARARVRVGGLLRPGGATNRVGHCGRPLCAAGEGGENPEEGKDGGGSFRIVNPFSRTFEAGANLREAIDDALGQLTGTGTVRVSSTYPVSSMLPSFLVIAVSCSCAFACWWLPPIEPNRVR